MIEIDPDELPLGCYPGMRWDWDPFDSDGFLRAVAARARINRSAERKQRRAEIADALRVIKAAERAGKPVKGATVAGVELQFGEPETNNTELDRWIAKQNDSHPAQRH